MTAGAPRGIVLAEAIVAIAILVLVVGLVVGVFPTSWLAVHRAECQIQADALARSILEERRAGDFALLVAGSSTPLPAVTTAEGVFRPTVEVETVPGVPEARLKELRVTVQWTARNQTHSAIHSVLVAHVRR